MKTLLRISVSTGIAVLLLAALMVWADVDVALLVETLVALPPETWLVAAGIHLAIYAVRALRFRLLVPPPHRPGFAPSLAVSAAHNLAAYVLPAKTGEASFVLYLKRCAGVSGPRGLASLLVSRLLDLAVLSSGLTLACAWLGLRGGAGAERLSALAPVALVLFALTLVFAFLGMRGHLLVALFERLARATRLDRTGIGKRALAKGAEVDEALRVSGGDGRLLGAALASLPLWLLVFAFYAVLARGFGLPADLGFAEAAFGSGLAVTFNLLPVNGIAGFGTQEAGWSFGFELLGFDRDLALASGIGAHLVQLFNVCLFGLVGHVLMGALAGRADASDE